MTKSILSLQNSKGETVRVIPATHDSVTILYRQDQKRLEITTDTSEYEENKIPFTVIDTVKVNQKNAAQQSQVLSKGTWGQLTIGQEVFHVLPEPKTRKEDDKDFFFFLKWTSAVQVGAVALIIVSSWLFHRYFQEPEAQVVKVFRREDLKVPVVKVSEKKITNKKVFKPATLSKKVAKTKKVVVRQNGKVKSNSVRSGNDLSRMGALSALGGMNKNSTGLGGLSNTAAKTSGYGFDNNRARGGSARGMLGKGLVQAGIGGGETLQGYGGYGTSGKGRGQAAYGTLNMAGSSGGYYLPLSEDAVIEGGLDRDQINAVIRRHLGQVTNCYEGGLQSKPNLSGRVAVKFVISPQGNVSIANVAHTSLESQKVESCIVAKLRGWKFPKPKGNVAVNVTYPFMLKRINQETSQRIGKR